MKFFHPRKILRLTKEGLNNFYWYYLLPDAVYLKIQYRKVTGMTLNLKNPKTLNEKMQWLKLNYRNPLLTLLADKYRAKEYIAQHIGPQYVVPTLAVYHSVREIDWDSLPDSFVIKCNHDSASNIFVKDKNNFDREEATLKLDYFLHRNYYRFENKQWAYKNIPPVIMVEPYLHNADNSPLVDYKFYCYGGKFQYFMYSIGEAEHKVRNVKLDSQCKLIDHYFKKQCQLSPEQIQLPANIQEMIDIAMKQGELFPHLRLDMYNIDGKIYIGEFTFYSNGGFINIFSDEFSQHLADLIDIKNIKVYR